MSMFLSFFNWQEGNVFESPINVDEKSKKKDDGDNNDGVKLDIKETLREVQAFGKSNNPKYTM